MVQRKLRPVVDGDWWVIGQTPVDLDARLPGHGVSATSAEHNACVDHHLFCDSQGLWHLWGCVRATKVGRVLYHWESQSLHSSPWRDTGQFVRADHAAGESIEDWNGEEWLQSPYVVRHDGRYFMLYGGHATGKDADDGIACSDPAMPMQMCLMTSADGRRWVRHQDESGYSRVFVGPGEVRDPCVIRIGEKWHCYYAGFADGDRDRPAFYCRMSEDLIDWSDYRCIHMDLKLSAGRWATECPHVVWRGGYFYLFRTENYYSAKTHVFRSEDPLNFGVGDSSEFYVGMFPAAAVEIYEVDGQEFVSSSHNPRIGTQMAKLRWVED